ncbi:hypothetical protein PIROE2DRAFT_16618, partial [Piromyces sp. E2]
NSYSITITNEKELINIINNDKVSNELEIKINDIKIDIFNEIAIENENIKKLTIRGSSKNISILNFFNTSHNKNNIKFIFKSIPKIYISHLTINGNLHFFKNSNIIIEDVNLNGTLDIDKITYNGLSVSNNYIDNDYNQNNIYRIIDKKENSDVNILLQNFIFKGLPNTSRESCINLYGNVVIEQSEFYGNPECTDSILQFYGKNEYKITIKDSKFDGVYSNNCLFIYEAQDSSIEFSTFEKGYASQIGG